MYCKKTLVITFVVLFSLAGLPGAAQAADSGIYEASVPVADQSDAARDEALRNALAVVLVRVTGDPLVAASPAAADLLDNAAHYAGSYHYERLVPTIAASQALTDEQGQPPLASPEPVLYLSARFDAAALERAIRQAGLPYWGSERPETLVWLAVEQGRQLVGDTNTGISAEAHDALLQAAKARGITLIFPLLDTQDRQTVAYTDIWAGFNDRIRAASERYGADAILVGRLYQVGNGWRAQWQLLEDSASTASQWQSLSGPLASVIAGGVNPLADAYAARYAAQPSGMEAAGSTDVVELAISGVNTLSAYGKVLDYVQDLTPVHNMLVSRMENYELTLQLQLNSSVAQLKQAIRLGRLLKAAPEPVNGWSAPAWGNQPSAPLSGSPSVNPPTSNSSSANGMPATVEQNSAASLSGGMPAGGMPAGGMSAGGVSGSQTAPVKLQPHTVLRYEFQS